MIYDIFSKNIAEIQKTIYDYDPIRLEPSEWVEKTVFLTSAESRYAGFFSYDRSPYSKDIINDLSPSSDVEMVAVMKCVQSGFTAGVVVPMIAYTMSQAPCQTIFVSGSDQLVKDTIRDRLDPVIQNSGNLKDLIRPSSMKKANHRTGDTDIKKEFLGGALTCLTYKPSKLRQYSARLILADEFDDAPRTNITEGSIRSLLEGRAVSFGDSKKLCYISSPTTKGISNIEEVFEMGDKRQWNWECPHCSTFIPILWRVTREDGTYGGIKWELDSENKLIEDSVHYECQSCKGKIEYRQKSQLNRTGKWIPTATPVRPQYRSYSFNALCIPAGFDNWITIVYQWLKACPKDEIADIGLLKSFTNTRLGQLWEETGVTPRVTDLMNNVRSYDIGVIPDNTCKEDGNGKIILVTLACDLGGVMDFDNKIFDVRLDYEIIAHSSSGATYHIKHGSIGTFKNARRKTATDIEEEKNREKYTYEHGVRNSVWTILKGMLNENLIGQSGDVYNIDITVIDTGHFTKLAYNFITSEKANMVVGIKGYSEDDHRRISKDTPVIKRSSEQGGNLYLAQVNLLKDILASNMNLKIGMDGYQPNGLMNFPQPSEGKYNLRNYFSHYEAEHRTEVLKNDTVIGYAWRKKSNTVQNHYFDTAIYTLAAREIYIDQLRRSSPENKNLTWETFCAIFEE
jgi:phage terminase large subunit GpA-like protein